jgi:hypothetical protein
MTLGRRARRRAADSEEATGSGASDAAGTIQDAASTAWDKVAPVAETAWEKVAPVAEDAYAKMSEVIIPVVKGASSKVAPYAEGAVAEGRRHGRRAAVKLRLAQEPKKSHKLRRLLTVLGIAGAAAFVYTKVTGGAGAQPSGAHVDAGQASDGPGSVPANETAPTAPVAAEESKTSAVPTDPDNPTERTDLA